MEKQKPTPLYGRQVNLQRGVRCTKRNPTNQRSAKKMLLLSLKSFKERFCKRINDYIATSQTGFDDRTTFGLMIIGSIVLWPFAIYHIIVGDFFMTTIVGGLASLATFIGVYTYRKEATPPLLVLAACVFTNVTVFLATVHLKHTGIYWVFPAIIFNYSLVGTRVAVWANLALSVPVLYYASSWADSSSWPRVIATMAVTAYFCHIFSANIDSHKQALKEMATIDPLTGARNRRELQADLLKACGQQSRFGTPVTLLILDIDNFKEINDTHGHAKGDEVLTEIAKLVGKRLRTTDTLYRYGGEEFLVVAEGTHAEEGRILAENLRLIIQNTNLTKRSEISISLGVAEYAPSESVSEWLHRADEALYRAKANGRNRVELANPQLRQLSC